MNNELPWVAEARKYIGLREDTSKTSHNPKLLAMLDRMGEFSNESRAWWHQGAGMGSPAAYEA
ncbi:baseplate hub subunit and tail lysozyme [Pseudomonas phage vB_PaeS-Yazdi-M]|uniref:Endolysin n=1 Tax=Pseudomonas phage vB_PaeS-Yazdi-M TaxID=2746928 RepID=A0A6S6MMB1_9CAUD|nr:baseplate hub subunit and tail lysozyme [Pseudomonas phage vB_PaeS-Yazdi-M]BCG66149.1 endolysin [Pseudomonas phage vB_PaeS-Yazdi-M]